MQRRQHFKLFFASRDGRQSAVRLSHRTDTCRHFPGRMCGRVRMCVCVCTRGAARSRSERRLAHPVPAVVRVTHTRLPMDFNSIRMCECAPKVCNKMWPGLESMRALVRLMCASLVELFGISLPYRTHAMRRASAMFIHSNATRSGVNDFLKAMDYIACEAAVKDAMDVQ